MGEDRPPMQSQPFEIGDLVRLNEELKQLREILKRKRAERDQAKRDGRKLQVDLTPEIQRLARFLTEVEKVSAKLKDTRLPTPSGKLGEKNPLNDVLAKVKSEIENEKKKLEAEREAREEGSLKLEQEVQRLRDELQKNKELLSTEQKSLGPVVTKTIEEAEKTQAEPKQANQEKKTPTGLEVPISTEAVTERPLLTALTSEMQRLREQVSREQDTLDAKRRDLELERRQIEEDRRTLEAKIADTFTATRSELDRLREQISRKQEELEARQKELYEEKIKVDEEKRLLRERAQDVENDRLRFMARKMMEELQNERSELTSLKRSLQQLRAESARDRKRLERDRDSILRARLTLENEKRKMAWKNTLLEIKARSALISEKPIKKQDKPERKRTRSEEQEEDAEKPPHSPSTPDASTGEEAVVIGVRLGEENYCIDINRVREILKRQPITPMPRQPAYVEGVMNVRGAIIPVINLRRRFDLKGEPSSDPRTIIVDSAQGMVGILVDSVSEVIRLPQECIHPAPPIASGLDGEYLRGICRVDDQLLLYLDVEKILRKATPISMLQRTTRLGGSIFAGKLLLNSDEQKLLRTISTTGIIKSRLKKKTKFGDARLRRTISSLARKGLVKTHKDGNRKIICRTPRPASMGQRR